MATEEYIPLVSRELERLKRLADAAIAQLTDEGFFAQPAESDNSVAVIIKHVAGNLRSRWTDFLTSDGEKPERRRDLEFVILPHESRDSLLASWNEGWLLLFGALTPLRASELESTVMIRGEQLSVLQAINRQLAHYAYHVGQIVYLAKHFAGPKWKSLSIPRGESERFNQTPGKYLERPPKPAD
jgi:hypothetical protein